MDSGRILGVPILTGLPPRQEPRAQEPIVTVRSETGTMQAADSAKLQQMVKEVLLELGARINSRGQLLQELPEAVAKQVMQTLKQAAIVPQELRGMGEAVMRQRQMSSELLTLAATADEAAKLPDKAAQDLKAWLPTGAKLSGQQAANIARQIEQQLPLLPQGAAADKLMNALAKALINVRTMPQTTPNTPSTLQGQNTNQQQMPTAFTPMQAQNATPPTAQSATPAQAQSATPQTAQSATPAQAQNVMPQTAQSANPAQAQTATPQTAQSATPAQAQNVTPQTAQSATPAQAQTANYVQGQGTAFAASANMPLPSAGVMTQFQNQALQSLVSTLASEIGMPKTEGAPQEQPARQANILKQLEPALAPMVRQLVGKMTAEPELARLWLMLKSTELDRWLQLERQDRAQSAAVLRKLAQTFSGAGAPVSEEHAGQLFFSTAVPLHFPGHPQPYPAFIQIYRDEQEDAEPDEDGKRKFETWLRVVLETENIGQVDVMLRMYDKNQLDVRIGMSNKQAAEEWEQERDEMRERLTDNALEVNTMMMTRRQIINNK